MKILQVSEKTIRIEDIYISLTDTFECGQCFRWNKYKDGYVGVVGNRVLYVYQHSYNEMYMENTSLKDVKDFWIDYFDLNTDYNLIISKIPESDLYLRAAAESGKGIRILKQDPSETIISFIISANNNIKRIKKIIETLSSLYGTALEYDNNIYYSFPDNDILKKATLENLQILHAGYRDKYLIDAFEKLPENSIKNDFYNMKDLEKYLISIKGVGPKVRDCILLFGFSRYDAFPKDVWIKRVIKEKYGKDFSEKNFGKYAGVYQQYMFHYARNTENK